MTPTQRAGLACRHCGSTVLRATEGAHYDTVCLSCGGYMTAESGRPVQRSALAGAAAAAVVDYAARARTALGTDTAPVISYAGLWLLLASLAPVAQTDVEALGLSRADARAAALALLDDPHPTVGAAIAGWLRPGVTLTRAMPVPLEPLPEQAALDAWADEHTRGLIPTFPVTLTPEVLLVLASALVLTPQWVKPLQEGRDGRLLLEEGFQAIVETEAAGPVAVAKPHTADGVDVMSVIAAPQVAAGDVWRAVDEVVARFGAGELGDHGHPGATLEDGHAWTVTETVETVLASAPSERWRAHLPAWTADADHRDLLTAPGVAEIAAGVQAAFDDDTVVRCVQRATATYDDEGFSAAAITAMVAMAAGMPRHEKRVVRTVDLTFDRPHALVAVARGGAWDGLPLFHCWVRP